MKKYLNFGTVPTLVALAVVFSLPVLAAPVMAIGQTYVSVSSSANTSASSQSCTNFTYNLSVGARDNSTGGQVSFLQRFLAAQGIYSGPVTGYFGPLTASSVVRFQRANGISAIGSVGPLTRAALRHISCTSVPPPIPPPPPNSVAPVITSLNPAYGKVGSLVTVYGSRFTADNTVHFNGGVVPHVTSNDGASLTFAVPQALDPACYFAVPRCMTFAASQQVTPGNYSVSVENVNGTSNSLTYTVTGSDQAKIPQITSLSPSSGPVGTTFTINGSGFTSDNNVRFDIGAATHVVAGNNGTTLTFTVPSYLSYSCPYSQPACAVIMLAKQVTPGVYNVYVENSNGSSNTAQFNVTAESNNTGAPVISSVSGPTSIQLGQTGTWSITARDAAYGSQLTYSVIWGDESPSAGVAMSAPRFTSPQQTTTFTHAYSSAGTYTVTFTVTNNAGLSAKSTMTVGVYPPIQY